MSRDNDMVEIVCDVRHETAESVLIWDGSMRRDPTTGNKIERTVWLPKSKIEATPDGFNVPEWLARDRGLI